MADTLKALIIKADHWPAYPEYREGDTRTKVGDIVDVYPSNDSPYYYVYQFIDEWGAVCSLAADTYRILSPLEQLALINDD